MEHIPSSVNSNLQRFKSTTKCSLKKMASLSFGFRRRMRDGQRSDLQPWEVEKAQTKVCANRAKVRLQVQNPKIEREKKSLWAMELVAYSFCSTKCARSNPNLFEICHKQCSLELSLCFESLEKCNVWKARFGERCDHSFLRPHFVLLSKISTCPKNVCFRLFLILCDTSTSPWPNLTILSVSAC